jgi:hypothetical protein
MNVKATFASDDLQTLRQNIVDSGVLGRSPVYANLLDYLLHCTENNRQPKEFEIAVDVLGRDSSFDVARDSVVRVYIYQLRKRIDKYYARHEPNATHRLAIPKGQYTVVIEEQSTPVNPRTPANPPNSPLGGKSKSWLAASGLIVVLLAANVWQWVYGSRNPAPDQMAELKTHPMWHRLQQDETPILVVMGDYYIFGELDESGRVQRMVRDFFINSRQDLANLFMQDSNLQSYFRDLDMTYMPEGSAEALLKISPILHSIDKPLRVTMMSRLSTADIRNHHIVYVGYISALDKLNNLYFPGSGLLPGRTFDEVYEKERQVFYSSTAGLPEQGQPFRDLALIATWQAANDNQFILISGTRDAGLKHSASVVSDITRLRTFEEAITTPGAETPTSYEALFEVFGIDHTNFDSGLVYQQALNPSAWLLD